MLKRKKKSRERSRLLKIEQQPGGLRLLWLSVGLLALAILPHLGHLRPEVIILFFAFSGWRLASAYTKWLPRNRWIILLFAFLGFSVSAWFYGPPLGRDPGVAFLIVMIGLKCVEVSVLRDIRILVLLGLFIIITHFLYADGVSWVLPLAGLVVALTWLMAQIERGEPQKYPVADLKMVGKLLLQAIPFVIILFYLFPRLSGSLFLLQSQSNAAITGLSDSLTMGTVSNLIQSDDVAFTATFADGRVPPHSERYWRGGVLWVTDGREWTRGPPGALAGQPPALVDQGDRQYTYEVEMEPTSQRWLYSLDYPDSVPPRAIMTRDFQLAVPLPINQNYRYALQSGGLPEPRPLSNYARWQSLQPGDAVITPRLQDLVTRFRVGATDDAAVVARALDYFNRNEFVYTLQPPLLTSDTPVDEFLFESRRGFCGHYASSFATVMRQAGVPARLVVGYMGGEYNPRSGQIVVRQSAAHAWTEVWLDGIWRRVDPTAAVAPERIEFPIDFDISANTDGAVLFDSRDFEGLGRIMIELTWYRDALKAKWNDWFVAFDADRQKKLLQSLGLDRFNLQTISIVAFISALASLSLISMWLLRRERVPLDPAVRLYQRFCRKFARSGFARSPGEGPRDFARRAAERFPGARTQIRAITRTYIGIRYAQAGEDDASVKALRKMVRHFHLD